MNPKKTMPCKSNDSCLLTVYLPLYLFAISVLSSGCIHGRTSRNESEKIFKLSREGFIQELVFAQATPRTPLFDDYTEGSYHVDKLDLLEGIRLRREKEDINVVALIVYGPGLMLWEYNIFTFIEKDDHIQINRLSFPHARITFKSTKSIARDEFAKHWDSLTAAPFLRPGLPTQESVRIVNEKLPLEWNHDLLLATWKGEKEKVWHSTDSQMDRNVLLQEERDKFYLIIDKLTEDEILTYTIDIKESDSIYNNFEPEH
jgi:hypothetical protein